MTRGFLGTSGAGMRGQLRGTTAILMGVLLLAPGHAAADDLKWRITNGGDGDGNWRPNVDRWLPIGASVDPVDSDDFTGFAEGVDNATFGNVYDLNGNGTEEVGEDDFGTGYTVDVTAGGNGNEFEVRDITFDVDGVIIDNDDSDRTLGIDGTITVVNANDIATLNLGISDGDIVKAGAGRLDLAGENETTGAVSVNAGRINVAGSLTDTSGVSVAGGATLGGQGEITGDVGISDTGTIVGGLDITGTLTANGADSIVNMTGGSVSGLATLNGQTNAGGVSFDGGVDNTGTGIFDITAETGVSGTFDNDGSITNSDNDDFVLSGMTTFDNDGSINAGTGSLEIDAATINLNTPTVLSGEVNLTGDVNVNGTLDFTNTGVIDGDVEVAGGATFRNVTGTSVDDDHTITSLGAVVITDGTVGSVVLDDGTGTFTGGSANGSIDVGPDGAAIGNVAATFDGDFGVGVDLDVNGDDTFDTTVLITNNSTLTVTGDVNATHTDAAAGVTTITIDDGSTITANAYDIGEDVDVSNSGVIAGGTFTNNDGTVTNNASGVISADVANAAGLLTNNGEITGEVSITGGSVVNNLTITGVDDGFGGLDGGVTLNGATAALTANTGSDIAVLVTNTDGTINAAGGGFSGGVRNFDFMDVTATTSSGAIENGLTGTLDVNAGVTLTATVNQTGTGTTDINGTVDGNVSASAGDVDLDGDVTGTIMLTDGAATLTTGANATSVVTGLVTSEGIVNAEDTTFTAGILNETGGTVNVLGDIIGTITNDGGDVQVTAGMTITGDLDNDAGTVTQAGIVSGDVTVGGGTFDNTGQITGTLDVDGGTFNNALVTGQVDGLTTNDGGIINADGGTFGAGGIVNDDGDLNINATTNVDVTANGGDVTIAAAAVLTGDFAQEGADTTNNGQIVDDIAVNSGTLINNLTITGQVDVDGGQLDLELGSNVTGAVSLTSGEVNLNGGSFSNPAFQVDGGDLNVNANSTLDITNDGGEVTMAAVTLTGNYDNQSGDATLAGTITGDVDIGGVAADDVVRSTANIGGTLDLTGGRFIAEGGTITGQVTNNGGNLRLDGVTLTTDVDNTSGNVIVIGDTTADIENLGGDVTINDSQELTGIITNTSGDTVNEGTVTGNVTVAAGVYRNIGVTDGTVTGSGGNINLRSGTINGLVTNNGSNLNAEAGNFAGGVQNNTGQFDVITSVSAASVTMANGTFFVRDGATLTSSVTQTNGAGDNAGTITGTYDLSGGTLATSGTHEGVVTVSGAGAMTVNDGAEFDQEVQSQNGDIFVEGEMTGDVNNDGGALRVQAAGEITGNVTQAANLTNNNGLIDGTVDITGGSLSQRSGADTTGLTTLTAGTLNAEGGAFSGGVLINAGTFNMTADTAGDVENDGASVILPSGFTLTGDVTHTSGNTSVRSTVDGDVTVEAGTAVFSGTSSVTGETVQNGGNVTLNGGTYAGDYNADGGTTAVDDGIVGRMFVDGGDVTIDALAAVDGRFVLRDGSVVSDGVITGNATARGGTFDNTGIINGKLLVRNDGVFNHEGTGVVTGKTTVKSGELNVDGGTFDRKITVEGGVVTLFADTDVNVDVTSGDETTNNLTIRNGVNLMGNVENDGRFRVLGTLDGDLDNTGTVNLGLNGRIEGTFNNNGTLLINGSEFSKSSGSPTALPVSGAVVFIGGVYNHGSGAVLNIASDNVETGVLNNSGEIGISNDKVLLADVLRIRDGGEVMLDSGGLDAPVITGDAGSSIDLRDGDIEGALTMAGDIVVRGTATSNMIGDIDLTEEGTLTVRGDRFDIDGTLNTGSNTSVDVTEGSTLVTNGFDQRGTMTMADGSTIRGNVTNFGIIRGEGRLSFDGGLRNNGGSVRVDGNDSTADRIRVGGSGLNGGEFQLDIDLSTENGTSDRIVMSSGTILTGDVSLDFTVLGSGAQQGEDGVLVLDVNGADVSGVTLTSTGLPSDDPVRVYGLSQNSNGDVVVTDTVNDGIAGLAGSVVLTQSLIGSVVNRPTSPFVSGLAIEGEDPCGAGVWARATGGQATTSGNVTQDGRPDVTTELDATFYGVQLGSDWACFEGFYNGWDMAFGGILGTNLGDTTQPVFGQGLDLSNGGAAQLEVESITDVSFQQFYGGVYGTAVKGPLALDLQYRVEQTEYTATSTGQNGNSGLGLNEEVYTSDAQTLSGAVSYSIPLEAYDLTFVPTAGFAYSQVSTGSIDFTDPNSGVFGTLQINDFDSQVGFVGGTFARTKFGDDGVSAINQFVTATVYNDFAPDPTSTFTSSDGEFEQTITSENLGTYGELSAGLSYVKILQPGEFGAVRQFNASVRGDVRYSDQLESWGLTAQARIQF